VVMPASSNRSADGLVSDLFQIIDGGRWDDLGLVFAEDCVYRRPGYEALVGLTEIEHFYRHERIVDTGSHAVEGVVSGLGAAACWGRFSGRGRDGRMLDEGFADTYLVRDGLIVCRCTYFYRPAM
jgi:ketosteroid isomerase-like protein